MQCAGRETNVPPAKKMSPLFHRDSLLARSYLSRDDFQSGRKIDGPPMRGQVFQPLWEESDTFSDVQVSEFNDRAEKINQKMARITAVFGGPTKSPFKEFHNGVNGRMCYVEDIYHSQCGHWANLPRFYHRCAAENPETGACYHKKAYGSASEDSMCSKCEIRQAEELNLAEKMAAEATICDECGRTLRGRYLKRLRREARSVARRAWLWWMDVDQSKKSKQEETWEVEEV